MTVRTYTNATPTARVGDAPASPLTWSLEPYEDLAGTGWTVTASWFDPDGSTTGTPLPGATLNTTDGTLSVPIPAGVFSLHGLGTVSVVLTDASTSIYLPPLPVVVEGTEAWVSMDYAYRTWVDAPDDPLDLFLSLESARLACEAFAPALEEGQPRPLSYTRACLAQARAVWQSDRGTRDGELGAEGYAVPVYPLDWHVKQLLRPKSGVPIVP